MLQLSWPLRFPSQAVPAACPAAVQPVAAALLRIASAVQRTAAAVLQVAAAAQPIAAPLLAGTLVLVCAQARAGDLAVRVTDPQGRPLEDAIVWAMPMSGQAPARDPRAVSIVQRDKRFIPRVTPVQVGTPVHFPNEDTVRHHVYSFSPAKVFSLKLYVGNPPSPVVFDRQGEVVLGCNIHDQMLAFVYGVDTPYFVRSGADGAGRIANLLPGDYDVHVWHPDQRAAAAPVRIAVRAAGTVERALSVALSERPRTAARE